MRSNCEQREQVDERDVVKCSACGCVQFVRADENCRKCGISFTALPETPDDAEVAQDVENGSNRVLTLRSGVQFEYQSPDFAFAVKLLRQAQGLSQQALMKRAHRPRTWCSKIENEVCDVTVYSLEVFARALEVPPIVLVMIAEYAGRKAKQ